MSQKNYLFLCFIALFVISGCIDKTQTQAEKVGWDQAKYEEYSDFYKNLSKNEPTMFEIDVRMQEMQGGTDFDKTWYLVFYNYYKGIETELIAMQYHKASFVGAKERGYLNIDPRENEYWNQSKAYFDKSKEYRLIIEEWNPYNPIPKRVTLNEGQRNFTTIQAAINAANVGDVILVGEGNYSEKLTIKKSGISIMGKNKEKVIIENNGVRIESVNNVTVSGFTIQRSKESEEDFFGVIIQSANNITVTNMIIINKPSGIILDSSHNNTISDNDIKSSSRFGIHLSKSYDNKIYNNNIQNNNVGVYGWEEHGNQLYSNNFIDNDDDGYWNASATYQENITNTIGIELVLVPVGEFDMGSSEKFSYIDNEEPVHRIKIAKAFYMGKYEVTQKQWRDVMGTNPLYFKDDDLPVENVSWNDVQDFIKKLNEKEGKKKYRLPSEAEWEYAARAGSTTRYAFGGEESKSKLGDYVWYDENSGRKTHPVGQKKPNTWGFYDMHGNVWEWVQDLYHSNYNGAPIDGRAWESGVSTNRVVRGGGWNNKAMSTRSAIRSAYNPDYHSSSLGFRLVRDV